MRGLVERNRGTKLEFEEFTKDEALNSLDKISLNT